ncbi:caspase family protein [bacterium]|nr:caspase family protein [bacterium]
MLMLQVIQPISSVIKMILSKVQILIILILIAIIQPIYTSESADLIDFQDRWAFLIGVGQYPVKSGIGQLNSPVDDVSTMRRMLIQYGGFSAERIINLLKDQATYRGVNDAFQKLKNQVQPEDLVVFYFSGRGSRVANNVFGDSEIDKLDECFLLYDTVLENGTPVSNYIRDDEIGKQLNSLGAKRYVVIIDACYQGNNAEEKGVTATSITSSSLVYDDMSGDFIPQGTIVLEACAPNEITLDGTFTSLLDELAKPGNDSDGIITIKEFHEYATNRLKQQVPQLVNPELANQVSFVYPLLEVISQPKGATIFVDDEERGMTPKHLVLPIGRHKIELRKRGYHVWDNSGSLIKITQQGRQQPINTILTPVKVTGKVTYRNFKPTKGAMVNILGARDIPPAKTDELGQFFFNDWSQDDFSEISWYEINISHENEYCEPKRVPLKDLVRDLGDFTEDVSLDTIEVDRRITVAIRVTNAIRNTSIPNAVVLLNQKEAIYDDRDDLFKTFIINPPNSVTLQVSRMGYEAYKEIINIDSDIHEYPLQVKLTPVLNTYSVKVTNQFKEPVAGVKVILNNELLKELTNSEGIAKLQRRFAPDEPMSLQVQKDGYELFNGSVQFERLEYRLYHLPIQLDVTRISLLVVDEVNFPAKEVQLNIDGRLITTDEKGEATISVYRLPNAEISLGIVYTSITETNNLQALEGGRFKILESGLAEVVGNTLEFHLPIPPEVKLSVTVQDQNMNPLQGMAAIVDGKVYNKKTTLTGKVEIPAARIRIINNEPPKFEFEKYGETYQTKEMDFVNIGTNEYSALVTLHIPYGEIEIQVNSEVAEQKVDNLAVNLEVSLDEEETQTYRLPATITVLPGTHQLTTTIVDIPLYSKQLKIARSEKVPIRLLLPSYVLWRACLLTLQDNPNDIEVLQSAEKVAKALGREDLAETFRKRRERLGE